MSKLKVSLRGAVISEIRLSPDKEYIGGRKESCDIRLQAEKGISREHFSLKYEDSHWKVKSLSRFGEIYTLGQRTEDVILEHNQTFQVPPYEFTFVEIDNAQDTEEHRQSVDVSENERTVIGVAQQMPYIKMLSSQGEIREMLRLEFGDVWIAGRDSSCQIVIPDQRVSRRQFEIRKINNSYTLLDMDSVNGTFLNGSPVSSTDPLTLKSGDAITVLDNTMYFELHDPNFQYKVEKLEIPPLQFEPSIEDVDLNFGEIPTDYQSNPENHSTLLPQYDGEVPAPETNFNPQENLQMPPGGPFVGLPPGQDNFDQNQYYSFQNSVSSPDLQQKNVWQKFKSNKVLLLTTVIAFLGGAFYLSETLNQESGAPIAIEKNKSDEQSSTDPFAKLTPEVQKQIRDWYATAVATMESAEPKYNIAKDNIEKIHKLLPDGFENSKALLEQIVENELQIAEKERLAKEAEEKKQVELTISKTIEECSKLITPTVTTEQMSQCLSTAKMLSPDHPEIIALENKVKKSEQDRLIKDEQKLTHESKVKELEEQYEAAVAVQKKGYPYKAIKAYEKILTSELPDPNGLKKRAKKQITFINTTIDNKLKVSLSDAEKYKKEGQIKLAVKAINQILVFDPNNKDLKDKLTAYQNELRIQTMALYQDAIIDESFGYVDGNETRPGAKDKWKKIIEIDLEDGEYYRKAFTKLKKYGVLL